MPITYQKLSEDSYEIDEEANTITFAPDSGVTRFVLSDNPDGPTSDDIWHNVNGNEPVEVMDTEIKKAYVYYLAGESSNVLKNGSSEGDVFGNTSITKDKILSITIQNNMMAPSGATSSWDASYSGNGTVKAWVVPSGSNYNLYIGANGTISVNSGSCLFNGYTNCAEINGLENLNTSNVSNMNRMFYGCSNLTSLDLSSFDTSSIFFMNCMFYGCSNLTSLDLSSFCTSNVSNMYSMFYGCSNLTSLDLSSFDTSNVSDMGDMFVNCSNLTSLDLSSFNTSIVIYMNRMFYGCSNLTSLDLSSFDTSNISDMYSMFYGCNRLTSIVLGANFSFKGNGITNTTKQAILPTPSGTGYSGKWIRSTGGIAYTPTELRDNYVGSSMYGTWIWEYQSFTISFNSNTGSGGQTSDVTATYGLAMPEISTTPPTKTGYTFMGWYDNANNNQGTQYYTAAGTSARSYDKTEATTLYAHWTANQYTIKYNQGTASSTTVPSSQTATYDTNITLATNSMTKNNTDLGTVTFNYNGSGTANTTSKAYNTYAADGWATSSGGTRAYTSGQSVKNLTSTSGGIFNLYPCFTATAHSATFPNPTRTGYSFAGWYTEASGGTQVTSYTGSSNITYYAHWTINQYYLDLNYNLDGNGQVIDGTSNTSGPYSWSVKINGGAATTGTGDYYKQHDYNSTYEVTITPNAGYTTTTPTFTGTLGAETKKLTIILSTTTYNISYTMNGGTNNASNPATYNVRTADITLADASKTGYTFTGWTGNGTTTPTKSLKLTKGSTGDKTYTANFRVNTYTVTLDQKGGTGGTSSVTATYDSNMPSATMPTRIGYTFQGYYDAESGGTQYYTSTGGSARTWNKTENTTLYAHWTAYEYDVEIYGSGYNQPSGKQHKVMIAGNQANTTAGRGLTVVKFNRYTGSVIQTASYDTYADDTKRTEVANIINNATADELLAIFSQDATGWNDNLKNALKNVGIPSSRIFYANSAYRYPTAIFIAKGSYTSQTGLVEAFTEAYAPVSYIKVHVTAGVPERQTYSITYNLNGGTFASEYQTNYSANTNTFTLTNPTRTGYTFAGWTGSNGSTKQTSVSITKGTTGDKVYTANWTANTYTVTLDQKSGTGGTASVTATYDSAMPSATMPTRKGYTFQGYYDAESEGTQYYTASGASARTWNKAANTTLYAHWTANLLNFDNQTITKTYSTNSQTANVTAATNGTGTYTYAKKSGADGFTVSSAGVITIPGSKNAGTYTIVITATDSGSNVTQDATYTIKINKANMATPTVSINTDGKVSWGAVTGATGYEISFDNYTWASATSGVSTIPLTSSGTKTAYVKAITTSGNYNTPSDIGSATVTVYGLTLNKGTGISSVTGAGYYVSGKQISINANVSTGYTWKEWTTASGGTTPASASTKATTVTIGANTTLTATTTANTYTVTLNRNNGSGGTASVTATYDSNMPSATMPTRTGYTFEGYYDTSAATGGTQYYTSAGASARTWNKAENTTLYARWTANKYTVTLNRNNGSGGTESVTATYDAAMPSATMPTRAGYTFEGYYDTSEATGGTEYYTSLGASARTWNKTSNTTLYARWTKDNYRITYNNVTTNYETLAKAYEYAKKQTGQVQIDVIADEVTDASSFTVENQKDIVLNIPEGKTITKTTVGLVVNSGGKLTINGEGTLTTSNCDTNTITTLIENNDTLEIENATVENKGRTTAASYAIWSNSGSNITLNNAVVKCTFVGESTSGFERTIEMRGNADLDVYGNTVISADLEQGRTTHSIAISSMVIEAQGNFSGNINIYDGTIDSAALGVTVSDGNGNISIEKGTIIAKTIAVRNLGGGTITIGTTGDGVNTESPLIKGDNCAVYASNGFNFYDGILMSKQQTVHTGSYTPETGYDILSGSKDGYYTEILSKKCTVTLNKNNGTGGTDSVIAINGATMPSATMPTRTGYTFAGYYDTSAATGGTQYYTALGASARTWNKTSDATLYARWTPNTNTPYTVKHYVHDLGTDTYTLNSTDNLTGTTDATLTLANLKKTIAGATYVDGYLTGNTTKPTSGAVTTTTIAADGSRVINLYYRRNYLYVQYDMNGGQLAAEHGASCGTSGTLISNAAGTNTKHLRGVYGSKVGNVNTTTYVVNSDGLHNYNNSEAINIEKTGYTGKSGAEWNTNAGGTGTSYGQDVSTYDANGFAGADLSTGDKTVTIYVNWEPVNYTISYDLAGGSVATANPTSYNIETATFTLNNPTKTGYAFTGWTGSNGNTPQISVSISQGSTGDKTYIANWAKNSYTATYNTNGGSVSPTSKVVTYDSAYGELATPTKTGYTFSNWQLVPEEYQQVEYIESTGTQYIDTGFVPNFDNGFKFEITYEPTVLNKRYCLISNYDISQHVSCEVNASNESQFYINGGNLDNKVSGVTAGKNISIFEWKDGTYNHFCNGNESTGTKTYTDSTSASVYLFVDRKERFSTFSNPLKIFSCIIYDGNTLVRNFIPCYRISDGRAGLYDTVTNEFYTNPGSDNFEKGSDVNITSSSIVQIPSDHNLYAHWVPNNYIITYEYNYDNNDMNTWNYKYGERFTTTYDSNTNMSTVACAGSSGWEYVYYPIETQVGETDTITFDYEVPTTYTARSGFDGLAYQISAQAPVDTSNISNPIVTQYLPKTATNSRQTATLTFTATSTTTYFAFNYGTVTDGVTTTLKLGNFKITQSVTKTYGNTMETLPTITRTGYTFNGWYSEATNGTQITESTAVPAGDTTYYAHWAPKPLIFNNQTITKTYSTNSQTANVTAATNGTGSYTYAKKSGESDITVSNAGVITIPGSKNAGTYTIVITATDRMSKVTKDATYTIKIDKIPSTLNVTSASVEVNAQGNTTVTYTYDGDGMVSVASSNTGIATASVNRNTKTITINGVSFGTATITVSAAEGTNYLAAEDKTITVNVKRIPGNIALNKSRIYVPYGTTSVNIAVSNHHGGTLSAAQRGTNIEGITTSVTSSVVTVGGLSTLNAGTAIIIRVTSSETGVYEQAYAECGIDIIKADSVLSLVSSTANVNALSNTTIGYVFNGDGVVSATSDDTNVATVSVNPTDHKITIHGVSYGTATITVSAAEGTNYLAPESRTISVSVNRIAGNITLDKYSEEVEYGTASVTLNVTEHHNGGTITAVQNGTNVEGVTTNVSGNVVTVGGLGGLNAGTKVTIRVTSGQTGVYNSAYKDYTVTIIKKIPVITLAKESVQVNALSSVEVTYTYDGDGTVSVASSNTNVATASVNTSTKKITINGLAYGTIDVTVSAGEGANYSPAEDKTIRVQVNRIAGYITLNKATEDVIYGTASTTLQIVSHHNGANLTASQYETSVIGVTTPLNNKIVTINGLGRLTAGTRVKVRVTAGQTPVYNSSTADFVLTIVKANSEITLSSIEETVNALSNKTVTYTYNGDGRISVSSSNTDVATVDVNRDTKTITISGLTYGDATITVSANAGTNYNAPTSKTISVHVNRIAGNISLSKSTEEIPYGTTSTSVNVTRHHGGSLSAVQYETDVPGVVVTMNGITANISGLENVPGICTIKVRVTSGQTPVYESASADFIIEIIRAAATLTVNPNVDSVTIVKGNTLNVTYSTDGDGEVLVHSQNQGVATIVRGSGTATISGVAVGETTVKLYIEATQKFSYVEKVINVTVLEANYSNNNVNYFKLSDAVENAGTVTVLRNVNDTSTEIKVDKNIVLDVAGYTVTLNGIPIEVETAGTLNVIGSDGGKIITSNEVGISNPSGALKIGRELGDITNNPTIEAGTYAIQGSVTLVGGTLIGTNEPPLDTSAHVLSLPRDYTEITTTRSGNKYISTIQIEKNPPVIRVTPSTTEFTNEPVILTVKITDAFSGVKMAKYTIGGTTKDLELDNNGLGEITINGNVIVRIYAEDNAGNSDSFDYEVRNIDTHPEDVTSMDVENLDNNTAIYTTVVFKDIRTTDDHYISKVFFSNTSTTPQVNTDGWIPYDVNMRAPWALDFSTGNGEKVVYIWVMDTAKNISTVPFEKHINLKTSLIGQTANKLQITFAGVDKNFLRSTLQDGNIMFRIDGNLLSVGNRALQVLDSEFEYSGKKGYKYQSTLTNLRGAGRLDMIIDENTLFDKAGNKNVAQTFETGYYVDTNAPIILIDSNGVASVTDAEGNLCAVMVNGELVSRDGSGIGVVPVGATIKAYDRAGNVAVATR